MIEAPAFKPKKSVALSGTVAGNTAICTVGRTGNDLHYRGYDILDIAETCEFEEVAYLIVHEKLPNQVELDAYKAHLKSMRDLPGRSKQCSSNCQRAFIRWMSCVPAVPRLDASLPNQPTTTATTHVELSIG